MFYLESVRSDRRVGVRDAPERDVVGPCCPRDVPRPDHPTQRGYLGLGDRRVPQLEPASNDRVARDDNESSEKQPRSDKLRMLAAGHTFAHHDHCSIQILLSKDQAFTELLVFDTRAKIKTK